MGSLWNAVYSVWNQIVYAVSSIRLLDILDILVIAYIIYKSVGFLRESRAGQLVKGLVILLAMYIVSDWWELVTLKWALSKIMDSAIIAAAVIFQPELRRILEKVGHTNFARGQLTGNEESELSRCIDHVSRAAGTMSEQRIGALVVFEGRTQLGEIIDTGTIVDAASSVSMVNNVFFPKSPLHDGAMIVRDGRIYAAGCILPLTQREDISLQLGTRHRAAIGMTENSDAVVLVVSEETGTISIVSNGEITRGFNAISAGAELRKLLLTDDNKTNETGLISTIKRINPFKKTERKEEDKK